jgi:hypothetical protein
MKIPVRHHCAQTGNDVRHSPNQRLPGMFVWVNLHSVKLTSHLCSVSASRECWVVVTEVNLPSKNYAWKLNEILVSFIGLLFM